MNIDTFFKHLRRMKKEGWNFTIPNTECIRMHHPKTKWGFCPITAVCYDLTEHQYSLNLFHMAGEKIDIPWSLAHTIISAADNARTKEKNLRRRFMRLKNT